MKRQRNMRITFDCIRNKATYALLLSCMGVLLGACGQEPTDVMEESAVTEIAETVDLSGAAGISDDTVQQEGNIAEEVVSPEESAVLPKNDDILQFVDAFGEMHETTIDHSIPQHTYDYSKLTKDGMLYTYQDERYTSRVGIDVSKYQGTIHWDAVKEQGIEFVFIRIGYRGYGEAGTINLDQCFQDNIKGAQAAGLDVGVYFFAQAVNEEEAIEEAEFVVKSLQGYELQLPVVYDPETIRNDVARTDNVTGEQFTKNTRAFCDCIRENGYDAMIYSNMMWEAYEFDLKQLSDIPIWYADYEALPQTPYDFSIWQYTEQGRIDGIEGTIDLNLQFCPMP